MISKQFLRDQGKSKKAEAAWFDRLEEELDKIEEEEYMLQAKFKLKQKMIEDKKKKEELAIKEAQDQKDSEMKKKEDGQDIDNWEDEPEEGANFDEIVDPVLLLKNKDPSITPSDKETAAQE